MGLLDGLLNIAGLLLSLFGVVFLFLYGLPYRCTAPGSLDDRVTCKTLGGSRCVASDAGAACDGGR